MKDVGREAAIHLTRSLDLRHRRSLLFCAIDMLDELGPEDGRQLGAAGLAGRTPEQVEVDEDLHAYLADEEGICSLRLLSAFGVLEPGRE